MTKRKRERERGLQFAVDKDKEPEIIYRVRDQTLAFLENKSNDECRYYESTSRRNQHAKESKTVSILQRPIPQANKNRSQGKRKQNKNVAWRRSRDIPSEIQENAGS